MHSSVLVTDTWEVLDGWLFTAQAARGCGTDATNVSSTHISRDCLAPGPAPVLPLCSVWKGGQGRGPSELFSFFRTQPPVGSGTKVSEGPSIRVLLVDDDLALTRSLTAGMEAHGLSVVAAGTATEALALIADPSVGIDVIVMDVVLPDSFGSQVAMERTLYRPAIPVVYISGYARGDAVLAASSAAGDAGPFLEKPFTPDELVAVVRRVAHQHSGGQG
jgi:CheY-like chemotaxis protein